MLKKVILSVVLSFLAYHLFQAAKLVCVFKDRVYNHSPGPCKILQGIENGSEDMTHIPGDKVLITSGLKLLGRHNPHYADRVARIYQFDFNSPTQKPKEVSFKGFNRNIKDCDFHGLSSWVDKDTGEVSIFVVNHLENESVVEIFTYDDKTNTLTHVQTAGSGDPNFKVLNDVVGVGPASFYVTNYMIRRSAMELNLGLRWGFVTYFDGNKSFIASEERFLMANGIERSADGRYIYVANIGDRELVTFKINSDKTLTLIERYPVYTLLDNIVEEPDTGDLWMGCHPMGFQVKAYLENPSRQSPSQVLRLRVEDGRVTEMHEIYSDDGSRISASTVAVYRKNQLLIGSVASQTLHCDVKYIP